MLKVAQLGRIVRALPLVPFFMPVKGSDAMSPPSEVQPARRRPGRPRKVEQSQEPTPEESAETPANPADERIGQHADEPAWKHISFPDGSEYRVEDGVIVERVL